MTQDENLSVLLFHDVTTDDGTNLLEGAQGVLVEPFGGQFIVEFAIPDDSLEGGNRFETAVLSAEDFAITGKSG